MNRRYSSVNGAGQAPSSQATTGRYSLAGRPSAVGATRASRGTGQVTGEFAGMNIASSQQSTASQRQSLAPRQSLDRNSISRYNFTL